MSRTMDRPLGTSERSIYVQLRLDAWLSLSARSAALQPARSSAMACFRVRASVDASSEQERRGLPDSKRVVAESALEVIRRAPRRRVIRTWSDSWSRGLGRIVRGRVRRSRAGCNGCCVRCGRAVVARTRVGCDR
eukprot:5984716-Pleurochrysis_carterae.AAC.3